VHSIRCFVEAVLLYAGEDKAPKFGPLLILLRLKSHQIKVAPDP